MPREPLNSVYLRLENITKRFGQFVANDRINLSIEAQTIHALLGENGAGKSTLMNILCGLYQPDAGDIYLQNQPVKISSPALAIRYGIGMIHQHFMLVPQLSVTENIILGVESTWRLQLRHHADRIAQLSANYGLAVDPDARVGDLPVGLQQRVEILKALYRQANLLILDEPTAVLTPLEVTALFQVLRNLTSQGYTIIFISHKLEEVRSLCDRITILRQGQVVANTTPQATQAKELAQLMVGRNVNFHLEKSPPPLGEMVLSVDRLTVCNDRQVPMLRNLSFQLRAGEILGVAGVDGNGQRELADSIMGLRCPEQGTIQIQGQTVDQIPGSQRRNFGTSLRLGYIPEDRQVMGLVMSFSIARNLILKCFSWLPFCRYGLLNDRAIDHQANQAVQTYDVRTNSIHLNVSQLSGGNQQKVVLARELAGEPALVVAMQPTRGLDVGATEFVQQQLLAQRDRGAAILYISTELEEVMKMGDRIAVLYNGQFVAILESASATVEQIGLLMAGGQLSDHSAS